MIFDANALSAWAEGNSSVESRLLSSERLVVPSVVLGEFYFGIRQSRYRIAYEEWIAQHLPLTEIAAAASETADVYAAIRLELKQSGSPIPQNDTWIAALARQHYLAVLSNDRHFDVVDGVRRIPF